MATDQLNHVVESAMLLSPEELEIASQHILDMLDKKKWDALFKDPRSPKLAFEQSIQQLKTQYTFIQADELVTFLRRYPFLIVDLHRIYEIKSKHFDKSPMDLYYISETGSLESATLAAYIKINIPRERAKDILSYFDEEWWNNISEEAKTVLVVDMVSNV